MIKGRGIIKVLKMIKGRGITINYSTMLSIIHILTKPAFKLLCSSNNEKSLVDPYKFTQHGPNVGINPKMKIYSINLLHN